MQLRTSPTVNGLKATMSDIMVFVRAPSGDCSTFENLKQGTDTIATIKAKFHEKEGVPPEKQKLLFNGEELKDDLIISENLAYQSLNLELPDGAGFPHLAKKVRQKRDQSKTDADLERTYGGDITEVVRMGGSLTLIKRMIKDVEEIDEYVLLAAVACEPDEDYPDEHIDIVRLLMAHPSININESAESGENSSDGGRTALHIACEKKDTELVPLLLTHKDIKVNARDSIGGGGATPLISALGFGNVVSIKALLGHPDIDVNAADDYNFTPLHAAVESRNPELMKLLLETKCITSATLGTRDDDKGFTALEYAKKRSELEKNKVVAMVAMLDAYSKSAPSNKPAKASCSNKGTGLNKRNPHGALPTADSSGVADALVGSAAEQQPASTNSQQQRPFVVGEMVNVLKGGVWDASRMVVKVAPGPLYDVDISGVDLRGDIQMTVLTGKAPRELRACGAGGSVKPRWSAEEIDGMNVKQLRHQLKALAIPLDGLKVKAKMIERLKQAMPQATASAVGQPAGSNVSVAADEVEGAPPSKRQRVGKDTLNLDGFDAAIARLWWTMAKDGSNNSDGEPEAHMWKANTWTHGNFIVQYRLIEPGEDGAVADFEIRLHNGGALPSGLLDEGSAASAIVSKVESAVTDSYNDIIAATNGKWIADYTQIYSHLPDKRNAPVYSNREQFLDALFCGQFSPDAGGTCLTLDKGVLRFKFSFRGDASNGNGWVPHHLRPLVLPGKDSSHDTAGYKRMAADLRSEPNVHPFGTTKQDAEPAIEGGHRALLQQRGLFYDPKDDDY